MSRFGPTFLGGGGQASAPPLNPPRIQAPVQAPVQPPKLGKAAQGNREARAKLLEASIRQKISESEALGEQAEEGFKIEETLRNELMAELLAGSRNRDLVTAQDVLRERGVSPGGLLNRFSEGALAAGREEALKQNFARTGDTDLLFNLMQESRLQDQLGLSAETNRFGVRQKASSNITTLLGRQGALLEGDRRQDRFDQGGVGGSSSFDFTAAREAILQADVSVPDVVRFLAGDTSGFTPEQVQGLEDLQDIIPATVENDPRALRVFVQQAVMGDTLRQGLVNQRLSAATDPLAKLKRDLSTEAQLSAILKRMQERGPTFQTNENAAELTRILQGGELSKATLKSLTKRLAAMGFTVDPKTNKVTFTG